MQASGGLSRACVRFCRGVGIEAPHPVQQCKSLQMHVFGLRLHDECSGLALRMYYRLRVHLLPYLLSTLSFDA